MATLDSGSTRLRFGSGCIAISWSSKLDSMPEMANEASRDLLSGGCSLARDCLLLAVDVALLRTFPDAEEAFR